MADKNIVGRGAGVTNNWSKVRHSGSYTKVHYGIPFGEVVKGILFIVFCLVCIVWSIRLIGFL